MCETVFQGEAWASSGGRGTGECLYYPTAPAGGGRTNHNRRAFSTVTTAPSPASTPDVSVVIPVCNEDENVLPLAQEIHAALAGKYSFEQVFVDDGSTDKTGEMVLAARAQGMPEIRLLQHVARSGQSAAVATGVRHARGRWIATLDGDGQNDPPARRTDAARIAPAQAGDG
jgi:hypothetical protein